MTHEHFLRLILNAHISSFIKLPQVNNYVTSQVNNYVTSHRKNFQILPSKILNMK